jgi:hypothetical protein
VLAEAGYVHRGRHRIQTSRQNIRLGSTDFRRQVSGIDPSTFVADRGELNRILEFSDVTRPVIGEAIAIM